MSITEMIDGTEGKTSVTVKYLYELPSPLAAEVWASYTVLADGSIRTELSWGGQPIYYYIVSVE